MGRRRSGRPSTGARQDHLGDPERGIWSLMRPVMSRKRRHRRVQRQSSGTARIENPQVAVHLAYAAPGRAHVERPAIVAEDSREAGSAVRPPVFPTTSNSPPIRPRPPRSSPPPSMPAGRRPRWPAMRSMALIPICASAYRSGSIGCVVGIGANCIVTIGTEWVDALTASPRHA